MDRRLELALLGRPRVTVAGAEVALPTRKSVALLAYLALAGPTPRSVLAALLWSGKPDDAARRNLRQEIHRLQQTPVAGWIEAGAETLRLREGFVLDVPGWRGGAGSPQFPAGVPAELLEGFELRGGEGFMDWLRAERDAMQQSRQDAIRRAAAAREAAGDPQGALDLLRDGLAAVPADEALTREAMRLSHQVGDPAAALELFERLRSRLASELDAQPDRETVALWQRVRSASAAGPAANAGAASVELKSPLIGREAAWQQIAEARQALVLIDGDAGVGKSRLALEFVHARGAALLVIKGREVSRETPLYPVADALMSAYQDDSRWFDLLDPAWRREVARLLPSLSEADGTPAAGPLVEARARFLEGLSAALLTAAGAGTIVFDDIQWYDATTAELMAHLVRHRPRARLLATARSTELPRDAAAQQALEAIARDGELLRLTLSPLSETQVLALVRAMSGSRAAAAFSRRLHAATAGNPLFILESLRDLFAAGVLWHEKDTWGTPFDEQTEDYRELPLSPSVRDAVLRRIDRLGEPVRRMLEAASLAGDGFELDWLVDCTGLPEQALADATDRAMQAELIAASASGLRFTHDLVRRSLDEALGGERRKLLHRRLADALRRAGAPAADIAAHLEAGQRGAEAAAHRVQAAQAAARVFAQGEALAQYDLALADGVDLATAFDIHSARVELLRNLDDDTRRAAAIDAMAAALAEGADESHRRVELAVKQAVNHFEHGRYAEARHTARDAIDALRDRIDPVDEAALLLEFGAASKAAGLLGEAEAALSTALERYRGVSALKHANCAYWLCQCAIERGDLARARELCEVSLVATAAAGYRRGHAMSLSVRAELAFRGGDEPAGLRDLMQAHAEAREIGSLPLRRAFEQLLIDRLQAAGRHDEAAALRAQAAP